MTITTRRFDVDVDPFAWGDLGDRESMKDKLVTIQVFNDGDEEVSDVKIELLIVKNGAWSLLGQQKVARLEAHTEASPVVGGAVYYDPLPLAKGCVTFTDVKGRRWERWSDGRLVASPVTPRTVDSSS